MEWQPVGGERAGAYGSAPTSRRSERMFYGRYRGATHYEAATTDASHSRDHVGVHKDGRPYRARAESALEADADKGRTREID